MAAKKAPRLPPPSALVEPALRQMNHRHVALDALERAAESIRPSWHDAGRAVPESDGSAVKQLPLQPPAPAPLPRLAVPRVREPLHCDEATLRTSTLLPETRIARAYRWAAARAWTLAGLGMVALLVGVWLRSADTVRTPTRAVDRDVTRAFPAASALPPAPAHAEPAGDPAGDMLAALTGTTQREVVRAKDHETSNTAHSKRRDRRGLRAKAALAKARKAKAGRSALQ